MVIRVYFRFVGVPVDRPGGPWWYRDFYRSVEQQREHPTMRMLTFVSDLHPMCEEIKLLRAAHTFQLPAHGPMEIVPPKEAQAFREEDWADLKREMSR